MTARILDFPVTDLALASCQQHRDPSFERGLSIGMHVQHFKASRDATNGQICGLVNEYIKENIITASEAEAVLRFMGIDFHWGSVGGDTTGGGGSAA